MGIILWLSTISFTRLWLKNISIQTRIIPPTAPFRVQVRSKINFAKCNARQWTIIHTFNSVENLTVPSNLGAVSTGITNEIRQPASSFCGPAAVDVLQYVFPVIHPISWLDRLISLSLDQAVTCSRNLISQFSKTLRSH